MKFRLLIIALAICVIATPAMADLNVVLSSDTVNMTIGSNTTDGGGVNTVVTSVVPEGTSSVLRVDLQNEFFINVDGVQITNYNMDFDITFTGSGDIYTATGTFKIWDNVGDTSSTPDIYGDFTATNVLYEIAGTAGSLSVDGFLSTPSSHSAILGSTNDPWIFQGDGHDGNFVADLDSTATTITLPFDISEYDTGFLFSLYFPVISATSLQNLFTTGTLGNGDFQATIVPLPAAVLLGILGLGVVGIKLRKYA